MNRPTTWVTISRSALVANLRLFGQLVAPAAVMPIIKSNAYGHGLLETAQVLRRQPIWGIGVANTTEGLTLRQHGFRKKILVLNWANNDLDQAIRMGLQLTVYDQRFASQIQRRGKKLKKKVHIHLKYDSGATRLGLLDKEFIQLANKCKTLPNLIFAGIFSHFAESESASPAYTKLQLRRFNDILGQVYKLGLKPEAHIACTAASIAFPSSRFDIARVGIGLYGLWPSTHLKKTVPARFQLMPVLSWHTRIIQVKTVPAQTPIGYGRSFVTKRRSSIALIPVGYWDGFDRGLSNQGSVLVGGKFCPIRGRICMNLTMIDVTYVPPVKPGTVVTLIGRQGRKVITADDMARDSATINYETVTRINPLIPRVVIS